MKLGCRNFLKGTGQHYTSTVVNFRNTFFSILFYTWPWHRPSKLLSKWGKNTTIKVSYFSAFSNFSCFFKRHFDSYIDLTENEICLLKRTIARLLSLVMMAPPSQLVLTQPLLLHEIFLAWNWPLNRYTGSNKKYSHKEYDRRPRWRCFREWCPHS